ncbi:MAG: YncE family protein [Acidobacteriota bacterium]|nr:YncE family protein [Acidobacteriota bacterium]
MSSRSRFLASVLLVGLCLAPLAAAEDPEPPRRNYFVYVCAESDDTVHLLRYGPTGFEELDEITVGSFPTETEGPHGINISPDGRHWFLSIAHGMPFGAVHKYETGTNEWIGDATLGMFPATMDVSPSTGLLYVVNFNLHGDHVPSTISVVETGTMIEVATIDTGVMPHGARMNAKGDRLYSVNMMDDELVEVDAMRFEIARRLYLGTDPHAGHAGMDHGDMGGMRAPVVKPTWATKPSPAGKVYVAGNGDSAIYEVDLEGWEVSRRFDAGPGENPYNLEITSDGGVLVATYKSGKKVGFWDLASGELIAAPETTRRVPHGVVVSDDDRYAIVTLEGVGGEPGTVEVYDIATAQRVSEIDVGKQAGGIIYWKGEP